MRPKIISIKQTPLDSEVLPVSLDEVKTWLIVDHNEDDDLILNLIKTAVLRIEELCKRPLSPSTVEFTFQIVVCSTIFDLPRIPVKEITKIESYSNKEWSDLDLADYPLLGDSIDGIFTGTCRVTYLAGYTSVADEGYEVLPPVFKDALKELISYLYEHRGDEIENDGCLLAEKILLPYINMAWL